MRCQCDVADGCCYLLAVDSISHLHDVDGRQQRRTTSAFRRTPFVSVGLPTTVSMATGVKHLPPIHKILSRLHHYAGEDILFCVGSTFTSC